MKSSKANFVTWIFRLPTKRQLSILLIFFPCIDIRNFSSSLKLQYCWTIVSLNKLISVFKETSFFNSDNGHEPFPAKINTGWLKAPRDLPPRKDDILLPRRVASGLSSLTLPPPQSLYGRKGGCTLTSEPKFLASIGYQMFLPMVLRWRASRAGAPLKYYNCSTIIML